MACVACIYSFVSLDFVSCLNSVNLCCFTFLPVREGGAGAQHWYWKWRVGVYRGVGWEFFSFSQRSGLWGILANQINFHHLLIDNLKLAITPYCFQCQNFLSLSQVLLVTSSFMSPTESRNGTNTSRVRFFGPNQLQKSTAQEKWDRVKIVCSQPYSKVRAAESLKKKWSVQNNRTLQQSQQNPKGKHLHFGIFFTAIQSSYTLLLKLHL